MYGCTLYGCIVQCSYRFQENLRKSKSSAEENYVTSLPTSDFPELCRFTVQITENTSFQWHSVLHTITTLTITGTASTARYQRAGWHFTSLWYITRSDCANLHQYHFADKSTAYFSSRIPSKYIIPDSLM